MLWGLLGEVLAAPLLVVGGDSVSAGELRYAYRKNGALGRRDSTRLSLDSFLTTYVDFRLKVCEAKALQLDTASKFRKEYQEYRNYQLLPMLMDTSERERLCREAYGRMLEEVDASHILISPKGEGGEAKAYERALALRLEAKTKEDFERLAREHSDDPSAKSNGGHLGYFSAFRMVYPFEVAAFGTGVGKVSEPIKTEFGYHIIRVHDRRKVRGQLRVAHIMLLAPEGSDAANRQEQRERLEEIRGKLDSGANFEELVLKYSQDRSSNKRKGELPWVVSGRYPKEFEEACYALKRDGEYSPVVGSRFGFHIIKRLEKKDIPSYAKSRASILSRLQQNGAIKEGKEDYRELSRKRLGCQVNRANLLLLSERCGEEGHEGQKVRKGMLSWFQRRRSFGQVDGKRLRLGELIRRMKAEDADASHWTLASIELLAWQMVDERADALLVERMRAQNSDLPYLLDEFYNGLLFFSVSERELWSAEGGDDKELRLLYASRSRAKSFEEMRSELRMEYEHKKEKEWLRRLRSQYGVRVDQKELEALRKELEVGNE